MSLATPCFGMCIGQRLLVSIRIEDLDDHTCGRALERLAHHLRESSHDLGVFAKHTCGDTAGFDFEAVVLLKLGNEGLDVWLEVIDKGIVTEFD